MYICVCVNAVTSMVFVYMYMLKVSLQEFYSSPFPVFLLPSAPSSSSLLPLLPPPLFPFLFYHQTTDPSVEPVSDVPEPTGEDRPAFLEAIEMTTSGEQ